MLFRQNTRKTSARLGTMTFEMSQAFHDIARFERFTDLNLFKYAFKTGNRCFAILFNGAYFLLAFMVEGDESSRLRMAN